MSPRTYLDYNATAPLRPQAAEAMAAVLGETGNPSSVHAEGRRAREHIEAAREKVAGLVNAKTRNVIFTSGGTEANMTALSPHAVAQEGAAEARCFVSAIEHPSVLSGGGFQPSQVFEIAVGSDGAVNVPGFAAQLEDYRSTNPSEPFMASVMLANNETGAVQPVAEIAERVHGSGGVLHCDAVQAAGKIDIDIASLDADMLTLSAHKFGGPQGVGALILGAGLENFSGALLRGGGQEMRRRAGTENVAGIAGFGVAADIAARDIDDFRRVGELRDELEARTISIAPDMVVFAGDAPRLANTSCFAVPGMKAETAVIGLDLEGVALSAGSACSSGKVERSHVLDAMGIEPRLAECAIRVSLGWKSEAADVEQFVAAWSLIHHRYQEQAQAA
jgi:cysteine desulfurase